MAEVIRLHRLAPVALQQCFRLLDASLERQARVHEVGDDVPLIDAYSDLIALEALPALRREVEASLRPAQRHEVTMAVAVMAATMEIPPSIENRKAFGKAMEDDLAAG